MKTILGILSLALLISCAKEEDSGSNSLTQSEKIFGTASSAMTAAGSSVSGFIGLSNSSYLTEACPNSDLTTATAAADFLGCLLTTNSKNPETAKGSFHLISEVMRFLDGEVAFEYGASPTIHENLSGVVHTSDGSQNVTVSIKEEAASGATWDYLINICILNMDGTTMNNSINDCEPSGYNFTLFLKDSDNKLGFKAYSNTGTEDGISFVIDSSEETMRFENWDWTNDRHSRVFVQGTVSASFDLDNVTAVEMAIADQSLGDAGTEALYGKYDGANLCITSVDGAEVETGLTASGSCSTYPDYAPGFFTENSTAVTTFLKDPSKGMLNFDSSNFSIGNYYINQ